MKQNKFAKISASIAGLNFFTYFIGNLIFKMLFIKSATSFADYAKVFENSIKVPMFFAVIIGIVALTFGILALKEIKVNQNTKGKGLAIFGVVVGLIQSIFCFLFLVVSSNIASWVGNIISSDPSDLLK